MDDVPGPTDSNNNIKPQIRPIGGVVTLLAMIVIWFTWHYRSDSFFTHESVSLGMSPAQVQEELPDGGDFRKVKVIDQSTGNVINFEMLEAKVKPQPWKRLFIVAMDGEVVGISAYASEISEEKIHEIRSNAVAKYGIPDDIVESKYGSETLVWGDVTFDLKDVMQGIVEIDGRAIIYRSKKSGTVNIYVTRDGKGPSIFF